MRCTLLWGLVLVAIAVDCSSGGAAAAEPAGASQNRLVIHADQPGDVISRHIYGHFSEHLGHCIYGGLWVESDSPIPNTRGIRNDVVAALRAMKIPVLRWPGGCFADEYHWKDGIGPKEQRPSMVNTHWGGVTENNHFGTHEFLDLCEQLGCEPYICGNVGSGSVQEMQQWVEYITLDGKSPMTDLRRTNGRDEPWHLKFFGVGNENWGCGGQMRPDFYADQYLRYATYVRNLGANRVFKIACGPNKDDYHWTEVLMQEAARRMNGLALHYYCGTGKKSRSATQFDEDDWFFLLRNALHMDELVTNHAAIMDKFDPQRKVALAVDEWGAWHAVEPGTNPHFLFQQNTLRDALVAGLTLNIFNRHCDRVKMANIAQLINVLQAVLLIDGPKMVLTPTYHVFEMYSVHQEARLLPSDVQAADYQVGSETLPALQVAASRDREGVMHVSLCNIDPHRAATVDGRLTGVKGRSITGRVLTAATMQAHNTFEEPEAVKPAALRECELTAEGFKAVLPPMSVTVLTVK